MVAGLATSHKIGLALVAAAFIAFALICSFVLPAKWPGFPGKHVGLFVAVAVCFTAAQLAAVIVLASEPVEEHVNAIAGEAAAAASPGASGSTTPAKPPPPAGNATAGKALFTAQGCIACHTFKPAGATAKVGPDLDNLAADAQKANRGTVEEYAAESIKTRPRTPSPATPAASCPRSAL